MAKKKKKLPKRIAKKAPRKPSAAELLSLRLRDRAISDAVKSRRDRDEWKKLAEDLMLAVTWGQARMRRHACFEQDDAKTAADLISRIREKAATDPDDVEREE